MIPLAPYAPNYEPACWQCHSARCSAEGRFVELTPGRFAQRGNVLVCLDCGTESREPTDLTLARHQAALEALVFARGRLGD